MVKFTPKDMTEITTHTANAAFDLIADQLEELFPDEELRIALDEHPHLYIVKIFEPTKYLGTTIKLVDYIRNLKLHTPQEVQVAKDSLSLRILFFDK